MLLVETVYCRTGTYFSANPLFCLAETSFLSTGNSIVLSRGFFHFNRGQIIWGKMEKSSEAGQGKGRKDCYLFLRVFSWGETWRWVMCPSKFEIFLIFPNILRL